jgi:hypothetical protein
MAPERPPAPSITITAAGSGRDVRLDAIGRPALLICLANETKSGIDAVEAAARRLYPRTADLLVCHLVDLEKIPGMFHKIASTMMAAEYEKAVANLPPGVLPEDESIILPDWDGAAYRALGLGDVTKTLGLALIDAEGRIAGTYQGDDPVSGAESLLAALPA